MIFKLIIMTIIALAVNGQHALAGGPAKKEKPAAKDAQAKAEASAAPSISQHYVHQWVSFPALQGKTLEGDKTFIYTPKKGRVIVSVFLASWCLPCQELTKPLQKLEEKYKRRYTDFVYVFAHDTEADARGFAKAYAIGKNGITASAPLLEAFHQPELPSIYVGDRYGWLVMRKLNAEAGDILALDKFLELQTAF